MSGNRFLVPAAPKIKKCKYKVHRDPNGLGVNEFEDFKAVKEAPNAASSSAAVPKATKPAKLADYVYFQRHESGTAYGV